MWRSILPSVFLLMALVAFLSAGTSNRASLVAEAMARRAQDEACVRAELETGAKRPDVMARCFPHLSGR